MDKKKAKERRRRYRRKHQKELNAYNLVYRKRKREEAIKLLGGQCYFCSHASHLNFHKKSGGKHGFNSSSPYLVLKNPEEWALVCVNCHKAVHWCMRHLGFSWEEIERKNVIQLQEGIKS